MNARQVILVIEDDSEDYCLLNRVVGKEADFQLIRSETLAQATIVLSSNAVDLILLDLTLPDSKGVDAISILLANSNTPVVVLSGMDNEEMAYHAVQLGAQDYLVKGTFDTVLLLKTIRYAIERYRLVHELSETKLAFQREQEQRRLQRSIPSPNPAIGTSTHEQFSLRDNSPELFSEFSRQYQIILEGAVEQRAFKVDNGISRKLLTLATRLGQQKVLPRDVVELHTMTLESRTKNAKAGISGAYHEEGRYLLIGILGYLCTFYRGHCHSLLPCNENEQSGGLLK